MSSKRIQVAVQPHGALVTLLDAKILDQLVVKQLSEELQNLVLVEQQYRLLLDLSNVTFLSSAALNNLVVLNRRIQANKGKIVFCKVQSQILEVLTITGLNRLFQVVESEKEGWDLLAAK